MPVLVTSNFDDESIKNEQASKKTVFSHYKSMQNFLDGKSIVSGPIWPKILCMSSLPASIKRIGSKTTENVETSFSPVYCKSMGAFYCYANQSFDPICPKTLCSLSPHPSGAAHQI